VLDEQECSSIEWQASLIESQFGIAGATARRNRADIRGWRKRSEVRLLDKVLKAAHNSASVLITSLSVRRSKQRLVVVL
jgi:predicted metal-dependent RNase